MTDAERPVSSGQARVDIVMATNRTSRFLAETLESVVAQTLTEWTLTVVDDGSPTPESWQSLVTSVPGARVVRTPPRGLSAARNVGMAHGTAHYVVFLDDDDVWHPRRLAVQVDMLDREPASVACHTGGEFIDAASVPSGETWSAEPLSSRSMLSGARPLPRIVTLMARRGAAEAVGAFDPRCRIAEDQDFMMRLAAAGPFSAIDERLVSYRRHDANASQPGSLIARKEIRDFMLRQAQALRHDARPELAALLDQNLRAQRSLWALEGRRAVRDAIRRRDATRLRQELSWGLRHHPGALLRAVAAGATARAR